MRRYKGRNWAPGKKEDTGALSPLRMLMDDNCVWNSPICSRNFETCTCGNFNQVVFAVYVYRDTGSRFFPCSWLLLYLLPNQKAGVASSLKSCVIHSVQVFVIWNSWWSTNKEFQVFTEMWACIYQHKHLWEDDPKNILRDTNNWIC